MKFNFGTFISVIAVLIILIYGGYYITTHYKSMNNSQTSQTTTPPTNSTPSTDNTTPPAQTPTTTQALPDTVVVTVDTSLGSFELTLNHKAAPLTVENFVKLATEGYCNNTKFHRIIQDFVIQGCDPNTISGDPSTWGQGGPGYTVPAEIGLKANIGAIGMASTQAKGPSSGSQFFIVTTESANNHAALDGNYTFFGYVTSGMDVVTKIAAVPVEPNSFGEDSLPVNPPIIKSITINK